MNVFKTPTMLNDGQQQPVDDFAPRVNLKRLFKDGAISSGDREVKETANRGSRSMCLSISDLEELRVVSAITAIRENSGLYSLDSAFWVGRSIENVKNLGGGHRKFTNNPNRGPVQMCAFFKTSSSSPPPPHNKFTFPKI
jgi:hypothetical protein